MQLLFKVPKLVKTQRGNDISFSQIAFHWDDWKFIRNEKITQDIIDKIKNLPHPRQRMDDKTIDIDEKSPWDEVHELLRSWNSKLWSFLMESMDESKAWEALYSIFFDYLEQLWCTNPEMIIRNCSS